MSEHLKCPQCLSDETVTKREAGLVDTACTKCGAFWRQLSPSSTVNPDPPRGS